jgi:uncharacterized protein YjbI with pentapeptide repeats
MKTLLSLAMLLSLGMTSLAQDKVAASDIVARINRGEAVQYRNVRVTGDLDLTQLSNKTFKLEGPGQEKDSIFTSTVTVPLSFTGCTFDGRITGYFNPDNNKLEVKTARIYNTNFDKDVVFENCTFEQEVTFKYSEFRQKADFSGSRFNDMAFFKYTSFAQGPDFSGASFKPLTFRYVKFPAGTSFEGASFSGNTDFKYSEFNNGVSFRKASFNDYTDFKYAKLANPDMKEAQFKSQTEFKYTLVDNKRVALTELTK